MICFLKIKTWIGIGIGASHYFGEIRPQGVDYSTDWIKLKRKLTTRDAAKMNRERREYNPGDYKEFGDLYEAGMKVENFDSQDAIRKMALETYRTHFPSCTILLEDDGCTAEPVKVLDGPERLMNTGNKLYRQNERLHKNGGWDNPKNVTHMEAVFKAWRELICQYEVKVR